MKNLINIVIFGGTGFVGWSLVDYFSALPSEVGSIVVVTRKKSNEIENSSICRWINWEDEELIQIIAEATLVINLAGENIASKSWSESRRKSLLDSRVESTRRVVALLEKSQELKGIKKKGKEQKPLFFNASAVGYYEDEPSFIVDKWQNEGSPSGNNFLSQLCISWEYEAEQAAVRSFVKELFIMRLGVVLGEEGALPPIRRSIAWWVGAFIGGGTQGFSWIYVKEIPAIIHFLIQTSSLNKMGDRRQKPNEIKRKRVINLVSPQPMTSDEFLKGLAKQMKRKIFFRVPSFMLKIVLGARSRLLLKGPLVEPKRLLKWGYKFIYPDLSKVWNDILKNK